MSSIFATLAALLRGDPSAGLETAALPAPLAAIAREVFASPSPAGENPPPSAAPGSLPRPDDPARVKLFQLAAEANGLSIRQIDRLLAAAFAHDIAEPSESQSDELARCQAILDPPDDPMPELPSYALVAEALGSTACPWLDQYVAFSRIWSPRAFDAFHEACGLWLLSTVAARRVTLQLGHPRYTSLYLALVARSSLYTKSTVAEIAIATLQAAGLDWLLAADDSTPQRFIHDLTTPVETDHSDDPASRFRRTFAGQRGWYYEEFGQHLEAMVRDHGMAQFRSILRRFDDGRDRYELATVARGRELVERPYLALLACMTPADMRPLARLGAALWHDGYLARFAFVTPGPVNHNRAPFPPGVRVIPDAIVEPLRAWHQQLGTLRLPALVLPARGVTPAMLLAWSGEADQALDTAFDCSPPQQQCSAAPEVFDAFYRYHNALLELTAQSVNADAGSGVHGDLDASYARHAEKALRVAMLLASIDNAGHIEPRHWARAQAIAERWRGGLHALVTQLNDPPPSQRRIIEQRVLEMVRKKRNPTAPEVANRIRSLSAAETKRILDNLVKVGVLETELTYRGAVRYSVK